MHRAGFCHGIAALEAVSDSLDTPPVERAVQTFSVNRGSVGASGGISKVPASAMTKQTVAKRLSNCRETALSFPSPASNRQFYILILFGKRNMVHDQSNPCLTGPKTPDPLQKHGETQTASCEKL